MIFLNNNLSPFERLLSTMICESGYPICSLRRDFTGNASFEELIQIAVSTLQKWSKFDKYVKSIETRVTRKNDGIAKAFREEGNSYYLNSDLKTALLKFNESIKYSLHPSIEDISVKDQNTYYQELTLAYANRAAVLFEMGLYDEACTDIRRAASLGYSRPKCKLHFGYCKSLLYLHLNKNPQSPITSSVFDAVFEKTETDLDCTLNDLLRKLITVHKFDVMKAAINRSVIPIYIHVPDEVPKPVLDKQHPHILGLSNAVEFAANVKRGSFLIAGEDIYPGTLLAIDQGFITATLNPKHVGEYCSACNQPCKFIFVPCHQCTSAVFCNELCRDEAFKSYHRYECSVLPLFEKLELETKSYLTLRIIASLGYAKLHDYVKIFEKEEETKNMSRIKRGFSPEFVYDSKNYRSVYYLADHKEKRGSKDLFERSCMAVVMTFILKKYTTFFANKKLSLEQSVNKEYFDEREMLIAKLILRHLMSMEVNATEQSRFEITSIWNLQCLFSLFGHSCNPNALISDSQNILSTAIIPKGTEITITYTLPFFRASKQERQTILSTQYYFTCDCIACVEDWQCNTEDIMGAVSNFRVKCLFGCENGTLDKLTPRCTKCSRGFKKKKSLYSKFYLKNINKIIYGSSSENSKSMEKDMALTRERVFTELEAQFRFILAFKWCDRFLNPLELIRCVCYNVFKVIYLFDKYGNCPSSSASYVMRILLEILYTRYFLQYWNFSVDENVKVS